MVHRKRIHRPFSWLQFQAKLLPQRIYFGPSREARLVRVGALHSTTVMLLASKTSVVKDEEIQIVTLSHSAEVVRDELHRHAAPAPQITPRQCRHRTPEILKQGRRL